MVNSSTQSPPENPVHPNTENQSSGNPRTLDPYIIHPSDNPATVLFSPLLQGENYGSWVRGSWLLNSCQPDIRASCLYAPSSHAIRKDLQVRFCISNALILFRLKSAIVAIQQETMSVSLYYTKIKTLWDQYDSLVAVIEVCIFGAGKSLLERLEHDTAMEFLQGLHDRFSNLRNQILLMDPFPTALRIFNMVQQEEEQQHITASPLPNIESAALNTNCFVPEHQSAAQPSASQNKRPRPHYDNCNRHGHVRDKCYRLHGFPPSYASNPVAANTTIDPPELQLVHQPAMPSFSAKQYSRLLALINTPSEDTLMEPRVNFAGLVHEQSDWSG
ncbi:uncharacterized protein LOC113360814 [Papaver somniferum]|uniref:uncharacterized protein LOC113360814 n=1 Tax=Papaver somniferum TaxID=3469 RepID=UPI000E6F7FAA|nr:uncharacterized protein LOC113360814 [Papaver somniferum]